MIRWVILTGEYPPQSGGVSDYTRLVSEQLVAAGDCVTVYAPRRPIGLDSPTSGAIVRRLPDHFGVSGLRWLDQQLSRDRPDRILIQYVPHSFGMKAMNLPFAVWVAARAWRIAPVWVMFHEVALPYVRRPLRHNLLAFVNRVMVWAIARAADRIFVSIPAWNDLLGTICPRAQQGEWLPVPCNVATTLDAESVASVRLRISPKDSSLLVGHFGTFGRLITQLLEPTILELLASNPLVRVLFVGRGSERYQMDIVACYPELAGRVCASGELLPADVAAHLRACDLLLQPYPDGVSSRRGSMMAGLANGVPVVTNLGHLSEPLWAEAIGVTVVPDPDPGALVNAVGKVLALSPESRIKLGACGEKLYRRAFSLERTIAQLRHPGQAVGGGSIADFSR